jgi:hypothetical protein
LVSFVGIALLATLFAGIVARRRYSACVSFAVYVPSVIIPTLLFAVYPERFFRWDYYLLQEIVHNLLKFAIALELGYRTVRVFPGALATGRVTVLLVVAVVALTTLTAAPPARDPNDLDIEWQARLLNGTIWLLTVIAAVILWYRLPVDAFHKAILIGFVPYLLVFTLWMRLQADYGFEQAKALNALHPLAYNLLLLYWNYAAWSRSLAATNLVAERQPAPV